MTILIRLISALSRFCGGVAVALIVAALALVGDMVVLRYGLGRPAPWQAEIVTYLMMAVTFIGAPYALVTRGHVAIDVVPRLLGRRGRIMLALLAALLSLVFAAGLTWEGIALLNQALYEGWRSDALWAMGLWIPYLSLPLGAALLILQFLADILTCLTGHEPSAKAGPGIGPGAEPAGEDAP